MAHMISLQGTDSDARFREDPMSFMNMSKIVTAGNGGVLDVVGHGEKYVPSFRPRL